MIKNYQIYLDLNHKTSNSSNNLEVQELILRSNNSLIKIKPNSNKKMDNQQQLLKHNLLKYNQILKMMKT